MTEAIPETTYPDMSTRDPNAKLAKHLHLAGCPTARGERNRVEVDVRDTDVQGKANELVIVTAQITRCCDCGGQEIKILSRR